MMVEEIKYILLGFSSLLMMNFIIQSSYPYFGCMDMSVTNIFRGNLCCVAFTNINYHVQNFQLQFYLAVAGFFLTKSNTVIQNIRNVKWN